MDEDLTELDRDQLMDKIMELRQTIRAAGAAVRDDKCWLDFFKLFELLPEGPSAWINDILDKKTMMRNCETFYDCIGDYLASLTKKGTIEDTYKAWSKKCPYLVE